MPEETVHEVKKYPNRRFYDSTDGKHVTLVDLYRLVRDGERVVITDSRSGDDITNVVLTQIILDHDPPKLALFPAPFLHQAIQANQKVVRRFVDEYFTQAMNAFVESGKRFEEFVGRAGLDFMRPPPDWAEGLLGGVGARPEPPEPAAPDAAATMRSLQAKIESLNAEVSELRKRRAPDSSKQVKGRKKKKKQK